MQNTIRVSYNGNDIRYVVGSKFLTSYAKGHAPAKIDITGPEYRDQLEGFVALALDKGKGPKETIIRTTAKNSFAWNSTGQLKRYNMVQNKVSNLAPDTNFSVQVAANLILSSIAA